MKPIVKPINGWTLFTESEQPKSLKDFIKKCKVGNSGYANIFSETVFYKGENPEKATHWMFVTNDGSYYKVGAQYMLWYSNPDFSEGYGANAYWIDAQLKKGIKAVFETGRAVRDKYYRT